ncbi:hypothetical protein BB170200_01694 [Mycobacterium marinum]|nr:hypothetical protein BB170200_01694 [Mycobacterium marinum]
MRTVKVIIEFSIGESNESKTAAMPVCPRYDPRAPALLISRLVSWVDDLWCRAIGAGV